MKNLLFCFFLLLTWTARAQNFEGTITWSMKMDISDPASKAKMEEAKKKASSPEAQANIKMMQEKMNDPQFKKMMESNPQMKAQMDAAIKMASGGDMSSMVPSGFIIKIKGDNVSSKVEGGAFAIETLYNKDKDQSYTINRDAKTYSVNHSGAQSSQPDNTPKVTKTSETMKILNYTCTKYNVEMTEHGRTMNQIIWATTEIKNIDFKKLSKASTGRGSMTYTGIDGVPLRMEVKDPNASIVMEVTAIKPESLPSSDFELPADFKETQGMFGR